jgi:hypothetical protein
MKQGIASRTTRRAALEYARPDYLRGRPFDRLDDEIRTADHQ